MFTVGRLGQRDVDALLEATAQRLVEIPREVGRCEHRHRARLGVGLVRRCRRDAVHLHEQLTLDAAARLVLVGAAALAGERVDLVDEDGRRRVEASHLEEQPHLRGPAAAAMCVRRQRTQQQRTPRREWSRMRRSKGTAWRRVAPRRGAQHTIFSESPRHLEARVDDVSEKKEVPHSVATAFARSVLPVPGGPNMSTPFQGRRMPCHTRA